jgi:prepilin-type N-terminal cleavage/methylation domain-containing protein
MPRTVISESGFTLVEVLATVVILGTAFGVFVGGMGTSILASDYHRRGAVADTALRRVVETLKSPSTSYVHCATPTATPPSARQYTLAAVPSGYRASVQSVGLWNAGADGGAFVSSLGTCPVTDNGLQLLKVVVTSDSGRATEVVDIVKRRP